MFAAGGRGVSSPRRPDKPSGPRGAQHRSAKTRVLTPTVPGPRARHDGLHPYATEPAMAVDTGPGSSAREVRVPSPWSTRVERR